MAQRKKIEIVVKKRFRDAHTKEIHEIGEVFKVTEKRYREIVSVDSGLVDVVADDAAQKQQEVEETQGEPVGEETQGEPVGEDE